MRQVDAPHAASRGQFHPRTIPPAPSATTLPVSATRRSLSIKFLYGLRGKFSRAENASANSREGTNVAELLRKGNM